MPFTDSYVGPQSGLPFKGHVKPYFRPGVAKPYVACMIFVITILIANFSQLYALTKTVVFELAGYPAVYEGEDCHHWFNYGNTQMLNKPLNQRLAEFFGWYSFRILMLVLCTIYNKRLPGYSTLEMINNKVFRGNFGLCYSTFHMCLSFITPAMVNYTDAFYATFYFERLGHVLYECHDIFTFMTCPAEYWYGTGFNLIVYIQMWGGMWESLSHELSAYGLGHINTFTTDTCGPGVIRFILNIYVFWILIGPKANFNFIRNTGPMQWHYLIYRCWAGFGAAWAGITGYYGSGYRARFYGPPNLALQTACAAAPFIRVVHAIRP